MGPFDSEDLERNSNLSVGTNDEDEEEASEISGSKRSSTEDTDKDSSTGGKQNNKTKELASDETRSVFWSKILMLCVLLGVAAAAAATVFKYTSRQEAEDFEVRFTDFAYQIIGVYKINAEKILDTYQNFAIEMSSMAKAAEDEWPFVTLSDFEAQGTRIMEQTGSRTLAVAHFVQPEDRGAWENYTLANQGWKQDSLDYYGGNETARGVPPFLWGDWRNIAPIGPPVERYGFYAPLWQGAPIVAANIQNFDSFRLGSFPFAYDQMIAANGPVLNKVRNLGEEETSTFGNWPESVILAPIYKDVKQVQPVEDIVACISSIIPWENYFYDLLPDGIDGIILVMSNTCNQTWSYEINGPNVTFLGEGDFHAGEYEDYLVETDFAPFGTAMECIHTVSLYPSAKFESAYETNKPMIYTISVLCIFLVTVGVFFLYDCFVERRQEKVMTTAERSTAIVTSLFPQKVADKLMNQAEEDQAKKKKTSKPLMLGQAPLPFNSGHQPGDIEISLNDEAPHSKPIAELFPSATVFFADIVGFTAWSSTREPSQVFELLEEIYSNFDIIARRKKVFKVETIGDCYMAATGLPEKRSDHAILMARYARDCLRKMLHVVRKLEVRLGPDTADLGMRIGIHSGPVTAGVLRGEKARFQLFGDTVNTAARMESTGFKNKIQISEETAKLINEADYKDLWTVPRKDQIEAKGKGKMQTYWLAYTNQGGRSVSSAGSKSSYSFSTSETEMESTATEYLEDSKQKKMDRSIEWGVDILLRLLKRVVAMRGGIHNSLEAARKHPEMPPVAKGSLPLEEVKDIIELPSRERSYPMSPADVELPPQVSFQLRDFVRSISALYKENPFHSFEHATHVTQSVTKLLTRVVAPDDSERESTKLHQYTYGITSDPLAQFAVAFSALIHDVDHPGVPNATLVQEKTANAALYKNKSVAEQNSVDVAWELLSEPCYGDLRSCIFTNQAEYQRFRQLVVNTVMATDIVDKELGAARKKRWAAAFDENSVKSDDDDDSEAMLDANRKATIVIEHLIQASDVAHTMQHWHVYLKWNQRFFNECYKGFQEGRVSTDPSVGWYKGELGFFDFYIIPLAKKLKECQVFGVASDEYLQYAEANRREWQEKGEELVKMYLNKYNGDRR